MSDYKDWDARELSIKISHDVDQTEWEAIKLGNTNIDTGLHDEKLASEYDTLADEEADAGLMVNEVARRETVLGDMYPFIRKGNSLTYRKGPNSIYEFCLSISFIDSISTTIGRQYQIAFERLCCSALSSFLGANAIGVRTGVPRDQHDKVAGDFDKMVSYISDLLNTGEWLWKPDADHPSTPDRTDIGDLGIDFVNWNPMPDQRAGNLFFLGQCACGKTNWHSKYNEPNHGRIDAWINPLSYIRFVKVFAIPFHLSNNVRLKDVVREVNGVVLDRTRIVMLSNTSVFTSKHNYEPIKYDKLVKDLVEKS